MSSTSLTRPSHLLRLAAATTVLAAGLLSGCAANYAVLEPMTPAAGVNVDQGTARARALVVVANAEGKGVLTGVVISSRDDVISEISGVAETESMEPASALSVGESTIQTPANQVVSLTKKKLTVASPDLKPGLTAKITLTFEKAGALTVTVPVVDAEHPDFATAAP